MGRNVPPASEWPEGLRLRYDAYLHGDTVPPPPLPLEPVPELEPEPEPLVPADPWSQEKLAALADELLWDENELAEMAADLREKRQVIFYGPSGTGKTYVARRIAQHCRDEGGRLRHRAVPSVLLVRGLRRGIPAEAARRTTRIRPGGGAVAAHRGAGGGQPALDIHPGDRRTEPRQRGKNLRRIVLPAGVPRRRKSGCNTAVAARGSGCRRTCGSSAQ